MTSAYEWIITTRSFHRTRIELSSAALSLTLTAEQNIWIIQIVRKIVLKKKYTFPDFNNIPAKAEISKKQKSDIACWAWENLEILTLKLFLL